MEHSILQLSSKYLWKWIWCIHSFIFVEIQLSHYYHFIVFWHFFDTFLKWGFDTFEIHLWSLTVFWHIFADLWHIFDTFMFLAILLSFNYHFIVFWHIFDSFLTHLWHILENSGTSKRHEYPNFSLKGCAIPAPGFLVPPARDSDDILCSAQSAE